MAHPQKCPHRDIFCFLCGLYTANHFRNITKSVVNGFEKYYMRLFEPHWYVPQIVCEYCYRVMTAINSGGDQRYPTKYVRPTIWFNIIKHVSAECYFCITYPKTIGVNYEHREKISYADVEDVAPARLRSAEYPKSPYELHLEQQAQQVVEEAAHCA